MSAVLFDKFKDEQGGGFKESLTGDAKGLLSLYEAAHFSVHGEDILDEAIAFCTAHLEAILLQHQLDLTSSKSASNSSMTTCLIKQVKHALNRPMLKEPQRLMSRHFLAFYKDQESHDSRLLSFAKMDFHLVQLVHQKDLATLTKWWKDSDYANKLPFTRDRIVESFFWALGIYWEPQYSLARCTVAKLIAILTIIDDIFDAHGTLDELQIFYQASQRWDMACIDEFPEEYMKVAYKALLDFFQGIEDTALEEQRPNYAPYAIELMKNVIPSYLKEAKWCYQDEYTPTTEEYLSVSLVNVCQALFAVTGFSCLSDPYVPEDVIQWTASNPQIVKAADYIGRFMDDIASHKFEQMRKHVPSVVECYMKEHGATEEEAVCVMREEIRRWWKDINEACINRPKAIPMPYMRRVWNQATILDVLYKERDLFTDAQAMKDTVSFLLTESVWGT
uniref:Uncharacterized protein n=1 Tax=Kalanchoe fedtschenkoi TaxID=63787 RepID=A0A7N1A3Q5_KALFE